MKPKDVYKGELRSSRRSIAVKKLKSGFSSKVTDNEIAIFKYMSYFFFSLNYFIIILINHKKKTITENYHLIKI